MEERDYGFEVCGEGHLCPHLCIAENSWSSSDVFVADLCKNFGKSSSEKSTLSRGFDEPADESDFKEAFLHCVPAKQNVRK